MLTLRQHRFAFILLGLIAAAGVLAPLFLIAGCRTLQQTPQEMKARETLRAMTRGGVLPAEDAVARIESDFPRTTAGALAKIVHARIKLNTKDFAGAAALLDSSTIRDYTVIGDYGLWLRADALEQANRRVEARAAYEQLARDYPNSLRARDALLHDAQIMMQDGQAAAVPLALQPLTAKFDPAALLLSAKAYEQNGNLPHALLAYRSIYILAPASPEAVEATAAIARLRSLRCLYRFVCAVCRQRDRRVANTSRHRRGERSQVSGSYRCFEWITTTLGRSARGSFVQSRDGLRPREAVGPGA